MITGLAAFHRAIASLWKANSSRTTFPPLERKALGLLDRALILPPLENSIVRLLIDLSDSKTCSPKSRAPLSNIFAH